MGSDSGDVSGGCLRQGFDGCRVMAGLLPTGRPAEDAPPKVSLFWSLRADALEAWRTRGLELWKQDFLRVLPQAAPILEQIQAPEQLTFASYQDVEMTDWHLPGAVVLGDSAHATSPQLGQGVNLALTDASLLAKALRQEPADLQGALWRYSESRREHLGYYSWATRFLTPFFQSDAVPLGWLRDAFMGPLCRVPPMRRQMLLSMAGVHRGFFTAPLPLPLPLPQETNGGPETRKGRAHPM
jgi:2-polyprenyl-6-methoxyphenol hydroxylase-like FAD-dependent oxidoreductase